MLDADIDYSDLPPLSDVQLASMRPLSEVFPALVRQKTRVTINLDADIVKWFKQRVQNAGVKGYHSLMNAALREYIHHQKVHQEKSRPGRQRALSVVK